MIHHWLGTVFVPGVPVGQLYGYRVWGPSDPAHGLRFDPMKVLLDPYGRAVVVPQTYSRAAGATPGDNAVAAMKSVVVDPAAYDWEGDVRPQHPISRTIIYEMHVRGFTRHHISGVAESRRGTYRSDREDPYLKLSASPLLNCCQSFNTTRRMPAGRVNYWGYRSHSFRQPGLQLAAGSLGPVDEFRDLVKALHKAGLEGFSTWFSTTRPGINAGQPSASAA
jgi:glycogen operon protein